MIRKSRWFYLGIATVSQTALATIHLGIPALIPLIQAELTLNLTEVGMLVSAVNIGVVVTVLSAGRAADRFGERVIIGYGTIAGGAIVMMVHIAGSFAALLPVFLLLGVPMATGTPAGSKAVAGWFPQKERGTAMGIRQTGIPVGGAIAALVLPSLGLAFGWRFALSAIGFVTIATGVSVLLLYKEPERFPVSRDSARVGSVRDIMWRKDIWAVTFYAAIMAGGQWCYLSYIELYLTEDISLSLILAASLLAVGQISGALGRIVFGLVSDRLFLGRRKPVMMLLGIVGIAMTVLMAFLLPDTPIWVVFVVVCLLGLGTMSWQGLYLTLVSEIAGTRMAGVAIGMTNTVTFFGIVVLPPIFGFIADRTESYQMAWFAMAMIILLPLVFLSTVRESKEA
jgi:ACS family hexuronate transporter-like MFS transporter